MTSQPRDKTRDSTKHDTAKFGIDLYRFYIKAGKNIKIRTVSLLCFGLFLSPKVCL